jgi:hypothetical protein
MISLNYTLHINHTDAFDIMIKEWYGTYSIGWYPNVEGAL